MKVYVLQHEYELDDDEITKLIGVYASEADAGRAVERMRSLPGFSDHPDGFTIDPYEVGRDQWERGFFTASATDRAADQAA